MVLTIRNASTSPVAEAGPNLSVDEGRSVILQGSGSANDNDALTYSWSQDSKLFFDNSSSATPTVTASSVTADTPITLTLTVSDGTDWHTDTMVLTIINVNNAEHLIVSTTFTDSIKSRGMLELKRAYDIAIYESGNSIYAAVAADGGGGGVQILNITDPYDIVATDQIGDSSTLELENAQGITVFTLGNHTYAAVAAWKDDGVQILDITNPYNITATDNIQDSENTDYELDGANAIDAFESGGHTYVAVASHIDHGVQLLNVTNPYNITATDSVDRGDHGGLTLLSAIDVSVFESGNHRYAAVVANHDDGVQMLNVTDPTNIRPIGKISGKDFAFERASAISIFESGGHRYAAVTARLDDAVQMLNMSNPSRMTGISNIHNNYFNGATDVITFESSGGIYAAVTAGDNDSVQILDVTDPTDPIRVSRIRDTTNLDYPTAIDAFESGGHRYVAVTASGSPGRVNIIKIGLDDDIEPPRIKIKGKALIIDKYRYAIQ